MAKIQTLLRIRHFGLPALATLVAILCFSSEAVASGVVSNATESALVAAMTGGGAVTFAVNGTIYLTNIPEALDKPIFKGQICHGQRRVGIDN
jgi:hypothetical protein